MSQGSSPLTRGKPPDHQTPYGVGGLIPAHAGKTHRPGATSAATQAHPRSRGENSASSTRLRPLTGSSPLTRGKPHARYAGSGSRRLIPAHAGKTRCNCGLRRQGRAHPRSRGENGARLDDAELFGGSSPLTRGKHRHHRRQVFSRGLIPAHAGKTELTGQSGPAGEAHPRSRGENYAKRLGISRTTGSSPLTRGKHFLTCAFTAQIDQILETLELAVSFGSYSVWVACATDAPQDQVRSIGLVLPSSRGAS